MGGSSTKTETVQQTQRELSPEEKELLQIEAKSRKSVEPYQTATQISGLELANKLLQGEDALPTFYKDLAGGISPEVTDQIVQQSLRDIMPQFQQSGIVDSGVAAEISARTAGDIRRASEEFNIGNKLNLLNLALSGQAQVQQPVLARQQMLNNQFVSASKTTTTGSSLSQTRDNPFLVAGSVVGSVLGGVGAVMV